MEPARILIIGIEYDLQPHISSEYLWYLVAVLQSGAFVLQMKIFVDVERRVLLNVESKVAGMCFWAELEGVASYKFVVDLYLDSRGLFVAHGKWQI